MSEEEEESSWEEEHKRVLSMKRSDENNWKPHKMQINLWDFVVHPINRYM